MLTLEEIKGVSGATEEGETPIETRQLVGVLLGGRRERRRLRRMLIAELIGSMQSEGAEEGEETEGDTTERTLVRLLVGGRAIRRQRLRRALVAYVLSGKGSIGEEEPDEDEGTYAEEGINEKTLARYLLGRGIVKRQRLRRALVAKLLGSRAEASEEEEEDDADTFDETTGDGGSERTLLKALIGGRAIRRRRLRKALVASLLRGAGTELFGEETNEDEGDEDVFEIDPTERKLLAFLIGRGARRRKIRRYLLAKLLAA